MDAVVLEEKSPVLARHERAVEWLRVWSDLVRALDAYTRRLVKYLQMCDREGVDPLVATRTHIAAYVRELTESQPSGRERGLDRLGLRSGQRHH